MPDLDDRIARFENMAAADPDNDMAHFSLGSAYLQAGRAAEAAASFQRCIELSGEMSKAYQLAGTAMIEAGWEDRAAKVLQKGFEIASRKGDILPRDAIAELLGRLGRPVPTVDVHAAGPASGAASFVCRRTGRPGSKLAAPPMRGAVGRWIQENISAETWRLWIAQGTKVINELRLDLSREEDQGIFDEHMYEFLGIDEEVLAGLGKT